MKKNRIIVAALAALVALGGIAVSQTISVPTVSTVAATTDLIQIVPGGAPGLPSKYATPAQLLATSNYTKVAALTAFSYTFGNSQTEMLFEPAGTLAAGYVTFAATPSDGAKQCVFSTTQITAFYAQANTGQSINNAVNGTALSANGRVCYLYSASNTTWDRAQ